MTGEMPVGICLICTQCDIAKMFDMSADTCTPCEGIAVVPL